MAYDYDGLEPVKPDKKSEFVTEYEITNSREGKPVLITGDSKVIIDGVEHNITNYQGTMKVATINPNWCVAPGFSDVFDPRDTKGWDVAVGEPVPDAIVGD